MAAAGSAVLILGVFTTFRPEQDSRLVAGLFLGALVPVVLTLLLSVLAPTVEIVRASPPRRLTEALTG
jgi:hypothetical protein